MYEERRLDAVFAITVTPRNEKVDSNVKAALSGRFSQRG